MWFVKGNLRRWIVLIWFSVFSLISLFSYCKRHFLFSFHRIFPPLSLSSTHNTHTLFYFISLHPPWSSCCFSRSLSPANTSHTHSFTSYLSLSLKHTQHNTRYFTLSLSHSLSPLVSFCFFHSPFLTLSHTHTVTMYSLSNTNTQAKLHLLIPLSFSPSSDFSSTQTWELRKAGEKSFSG
jgi:hypothetical protein